MALCGKHDDVLRIPETRNPKRVPFPANREHRDARGHQFRPPGPLRTAGRMQREGQRDHRVRAGHTRGAAGQPGTVAAPALNERNTAPPAFAAQRRHDIHPGFILPDRRTRCAATAHPVRLDDPGDSAAERQHGIPGREQIRCLDPASRAMGEHNQNGRLPRIRTLNQDTGIAVTAGNRETFRLSVPGR